MKRNDRWSLCGMVALLIWQCPDAVAHSVACAGGLGSFEPRHRTPASIGGADSVC